MQQNESKSLNTPLNKTPSTSQTSINPQHITIDYQNKASTSHSHTNIKQKNRGIQRTPEQPQTRCNPDRIAKRKTPTLSVVNPQISPVSSSRNSRVSSQPPFPIIKLPPAILNTPPQNSPSSPIDTANFHPD